jgi:hypothetical protein
VSADVEDGKELPWETAVVHSHASQSMLNGMTEYEVSGRPGNGEYAAYAEPDISQVAGDDAVAALSAQSVDVIALFVGLNDQSIDGLTYAVGKWTLKQVLGHIIDDERIFAYRALCVARQDRRRFQGSTRIVT